MSTIEDRLRDAAASINQRMEQVSIPVSMNQPQSSARLGFRASAFAALAAAAVVVVVAVVAAIGSHGRASDPRQPLAPSASAAPVNLSARLLTVGDLPKGWRSVRFASNLPANRCLPDLTAQSGHRWGALFESPAGVPGANIQGTNLQEVLTAEPIATSEREFAAVRSALSQCHNISVSLLGPSDRLNASPLDMAPIGDESTAYVVTLNSEASADHAETTIRIAVALIRSGNVRIDVLLYAADVDVHQLRDFAQKAVEKVDKR